MARPKGPAKFTPELLARAREMRRHLVPIGEIALQLKVSRSRLYDLIDEAPAAAICPISSPLPSSRSPSDGDGAVLEAVSSIDDVAMLDELLRDAIQSQREEKASKNLAGQIAASRLVSELVRRRRQLAPPVVPTLEELEAKSRPQADAVVRKVVDGVRMLAKREASSGCCARCGGPLTSAMIELRQVFAQGGVV